MSVLRAANDIRTTERTVLIAELGLDGRLRPVRGILPAVMAAVQAGYPDIVVAHANSAEAALVPGANVRGYRTLARRTGSVCACQPPFVVAYTQLFCVRRKFSVATGIPQCEDDPSQVMEAGLRGLTSTLRHGAKSIGCTSATGMLVWDSCEGKRCLRLVTRAQQ